MYDTVYCIEDYIICIYIFSADALVNSSNN